MMPHQFIDRSSGKVVTESLLGDRFVQLLYGPAREIAPAVFKLLTCARASRWLSVLQFDCAAKKNPKAARALFHGLGLDPAECADPVDSFSCARDVFERRIKYWRLRPMPTRQDCVVAPADAKLIVGSLNETSDLFIKEKFFSYGELLGPRNHNWITLFKEGDFALFRLTPEKYHYNHFPVSGRVVDFYGIEGAHHACNPAAVVATVTPYSKNKRVVTIIDTDVPGGTGVGYVAMIEVVALMIGDIVQCYSARHYENPVEDLLGRFVPRGQPKSLFRPGSSVDVLFFQKGRIIFDEDLIVNRNRCDVNSRFSMGFKQPLVETDVRLRSSLAGAAHNRCGSDSVGFDRKRSFHWTPP